MDIPVLTLNQWIMAGMIVAFSILLAGWIFLSIFSKKFRNIMYRYDEDPSAFTHEQKMTYKCEEEMSAIWFGGIFEILETIFGRTTKPLGRKHLLSVIVWILVIVCIIGFFGGFYNRVIWLFFGLFIILATFIIFRTLGCVMDTPFMSEVIT